MILQAVNIALKLNRILLFEGVEFILKAGDALIIHGSNGAGKTSLLKVISGLIPPSLGTIFWDHQSIQEHPQSFRQAMGYIGHHAGLKAELSVFDNLKYLLAMDGAKAEPEILEKIGLEQKKNEPVATLSFGQKRRLLLARMMFSRKKIWILDEPFAGVDQQGIEWAQEKISEHLNKGSIMILTSHQPFVVKALRYFQMKL